MYDFDLFVIGAGSGGVRAARIASENGAKVAIAEEYRMGGTCVIRGCIPKKLMVFAAHYAADFEDAEGYGWSFDSPPKFSWTALIEAKDDEIDRLNRLYYGTLKNANVEAFEHRAVLKDAHTILLDDGREVSAETILIATGGAPFMPEIDGIEYAISSNEVFHLPEQPKRILICGAGYIAVEFAAIFNGLGSHVEIAYRKDKLLRGFDEDLRDALGREMRDVGIRVRYNTEVVSIAKQDDGLLVTYNDGSTAQYDQVMFATGRKPNVQGLGLSELGVAMKYNGAIAVDDYSRTSVANIYAVGDVTDRVNLTPVAIREGHAFALNKYAGLDISPEHDYVPAAVFSQPPIGTVGLSEELAREHHGEIDVYVSEFRPLKHTLSGSGERCFMKLIVECKTDRVIAAHMIGPDAPEIIQGIAIAVKNGLTKAQFDRTIAIHPTSAEEFVLMKTPRAVTTDGE